MRGGNRRHIRMVATATRLTVTLMRMTKTTNPQRKSWIRIPLTAFLLWFAVKSISQGWNTFTSDEDWSDDYLRSTATIVDGREQLVTSTVANRSSYYRCHHVVGFSHDGRTYRHEPVWLKDETYDQKRGDDCAAGRIGEKIDVWLVTSAAEPYILEPGNRNSKPLSGVFNIIFGLLALVGLHRIWLSRRYVQKNKAESGKASDASVGEDP